MIASFLGWTVDAFDFFVLVFVLSKAAADFHVSLKDQMTLAITVTRNGALVDVIAEPSELVAA